MALDCGQPLTGMEGDEFMIYTFKVLPCTRKGAHSWTECAFTHPGEKAARRCPKSFIYSAEACPDARKSGKCARGDLCPYSHGVFEQWLHPSRYRTQLCSFGTACRRPVCFFAHTVQELRVPTACGPVPAAPPSAASPAGLDPATAAALAAASGRSSGADYLALMQQALLAQAMHPAAAAAAALPPQLDGATATMINRLQAASCAALANAAACQRQQQQHQAAAAAAAAAAIAAASSNPASLLHMAQAAQAYQAAAQAAATAAANVHMQPGQQQHQQQQDTSSAASSAASSLGSRAASGAFGAPSASSRSTSSSASSPTCGSNASSLFQAPSASTLGGFHPAGELPPASAAAGCAADGSAWYLQQALAAAAAKGQLASSPTGRASREFPPSAFGGLPLPASSSAAFMPWLPGSSGGLALDLGTGFGAAPASGYGGFMPATPGISDGALGGAGCSLDALASQLSRQMSLQSLFQA